MSEDERKVEIEEKIKELEAEMSKPDFWNDKDMAQAKVKEFQKLKDDLEMGPTKSPYDRGEAVVTIFSGAGGDDAEDFSAMLLKMYFKYFEKKGWGYSVVHENQNDHGGYRNITVHISGKNIYCTLKKESGVKRIC